MDAHRSGDLQSKLDREGLAERFQLACNAFPLQTNGRFNLLLRDGGLRLAGRNFSVGRFDRRPIVPAAASTARTPAIRVCQS